MTKWVVLAAAGALAGIAATSSVARGHDGPMTTPVQRPVVLKLVTADELWSSEFAAAVQRLSGGAIRIDVKVGGAWNLDYERVLVGKVRAGDAELVGVGARAWDRLGVTSFQPLVAPFLVQSLEHQRRVLSGNAPARMLAELEPLGLVGLAVLPGPLRRPFGVTRPLVEPGDYAGATVGLRYGRIAEDTLRRLGATPKAYRVGTLGRVEGAELDPEAIAGNQYDDKGTSLTANVVLWPRPQTIAIGRPAFDRLSPAQRIILLRAARAATAPSLTRLRREQERSLAEICQRGELSLVTASAVQLAALRARVAPIIAGLERDPVTRSLLAKIRAAGEAVPPDVVSCSEGSRP
jgi:TRAP-type C4-dicarboxylate transport system substrate-binding protein